MDFLTLIQEGRDDPARLEQAYRDASATGQEAAFARALDTAYDTAPDNLLYGAWHHRLAYAGAEDGPASAPPGRSIAWARAVVLAALNGLIFWQLAWQEVPFVPDTWETPAIILLWAPITAAFVLIFLVWNDRSRRGRLALVLTGLVAAALLGRVGYQWIQASHLGDAYLQLLALHLPILAWAAVGIAVMPRRREGDENRFAFALKSLDVAVVGGLFAIAGGLFVAITIALFDMLGITLSDFVMLLLTVGGAGLLPVLVVAVVYDPDKEPVDQSFEDGLSTVVAMLMRLLLPLTMAVLAVYLAFIPFNFREPFENRDVLITYTGMLFAVMALLVGATPATGPRLSVHAQRWLQRGLVVTAALAALVGVYALTAIGYRTWQHDWTPNRVAFVGWDIINIALLLALIGRQVKAPRERWLARLHRTVSMGIVSYVLWAGIVILAVPILFHG